MKKYFWSFISLGFLSFLALAITLSLILAHYSYGTRSSCEVEFTLKTPKPVNFAIYYDIGEGLSQKFHQQKFIETINEKTILSFCIASFRQLRTIRFDPAMQPVSMDIYSVILRYSDGTKYNVPLDSLTAGNQISTNTLSNGTLTFSTLPDANDPTFVLSKLNDGHAPDNSWDKLFHYSIWILSALAFSLVARFFHLYFLLGL